MQSLKLLSSSSSWSDLNKKLEGLIQSLKITNSSYIFLYEIEKSVDTESLFRGLNYKASIPIFISTKRSKGATTLTRLRITSHDIKSNALKNKSCTNF